jgi:predicted O-methyltransferase YrrM
MDKAIEALLDEYDERSRREWAGERPVQITTDRRDQMLLSVGRDAGKFLNQLARGVEAKQILELGTSYGYSTIWLAEAAKAVGGKVISLDVADYKQAFAREKLASVGLDGVVDFHAGDALEILRTLKGPFDLVLLDIWKDVYVPALDLFYPNLAPGAVIVADNMLMPAVDRTNALTYRRAVRAKPRISSVLLPIGQGLEISRLQGPQDEGL